MQAICIVNCVQSTSDCRIHTRGTHLDSQNPKFCNCVSSPYQTRDKDDVLQTVLSLRMGMSTAYSFRCYGTSSYVGMQFQMPMGSHRHLKSSASSMADGSPWAASNSVTTCACGRPACLLSLFQPALNGCQ